MMHVLRPDEMLARLTKPELIPAEQFDLKPEDCLIVCAGFEDRATGVIERTPPGSKFTVVIIDYLPFVAENRLEPLESFCRNRNLRFLKLTYDRQNPVGFGAALQLAIADVRGIIHLDISAMSRLLIVQSLCALAERENRLHRCSVVYAEATDYPPCKIEVERALEKAKENPIQTVLLLSSGVFDICIVPELSSPTLGATQTRLVAFPTFSADQLTALLNELGPSRITLIEGDPPSEQNKWRTDAIRKVNGLQNISYESILTSTLDYRETLSALLGLYAAHSERERILISPTGSKMQTVAVGLFRAVIGDAQIVYPTPKDFCSPTNYTQGVGVCYILPLDWLHGP